MKTLGESEIVPQCPHCLAKFPHWTWEQTKRHVKFCTGPGARRTFNLKDEYLHCLYCDPSDPPWRDFKELAAHVIRDHNPQGYSDQSKEMDEAMKLAENVISQNQQLQPMMLANLGNRAKIVGVREAGAIYQYSDYCIDLQFGRSTFELPIKAINEDFKALAKSLGLDTDKWNGKTVVLSTEPYTSTRTQKESEIIRFELEPNKK